MSERMKQEERMQGVAPAALWQHRKRGREALQLEITGDYDAAARAWQQTANRAPHPQWRMFARERARRCRAKSLFVREVADGSHNGTESGIPCAVRGRRPA